jgi:hypothetical protein
MCQFHAAARSLPDNGDPGRPERNDDAAVDIRGNRADRTHLFCLFYQVEIRSPPPARGTEGGPSDSAAVFRRNCELRIPQTRDYVNTAFGERVDTLAIPAKA